QLNADFRGLRTDAPLFFGFNRIGIDEDGDTNPDYYLQFDMMHFFADGDFQTMNPYGGDVVSGNLSRVYYGHANTSSGANNYMDHAVLSRRSHILSSDSDLNTILVNMWVPPWGQVPNITDISGTGNIDYDVFDNYFDAAVNALFEVDTVTLTQWKNIFLYDDDPTATVDPANAEQFLANTMTTAGRPVIDFSSTWTYHLLMAQGVMDFKIQFADFNIATQQWQWFPSEDPDGNGDYTDSDFSAGQNVFGYYYNMPDNISVDMDGAGPSDDWSLQTVIPKALKFTFRLKDSNNMFPDGKTFTHIVYLDN
ncbi:MAG: hypothetical protein ISS71_07300, partial [Phycisphaerae bacterium]|nr:hypothetical protein [Phycisphaerae bacterium]